MQLKEMLPWNWGKKNVPVHRDQTRGFEAQTPLPSVLSLRSSVDRLFDDFFGEFPGFGSQMAPSWAAPIGAGDSRFLPPLDASETEDAYTISLELPGLDEKDVDISLTDDAVTIRGRKSEESERDENGAHWIERRYGSFQRIVPLPVAVAADEVKATFRRGVLTLTLPKAESARIEARRVPIET